VLRLLAEGQTETVNLMEWLAADMPSLARNVAGQVTSPRLQTALVAASEGMTDRGVTARLSIAGKAIAASVDAFEDRHFAALANHPSDIVRQWACYAVNDDYREVSLERRLADTMPFAADRNMSVREAAWMAFRPYVAPSLGKVLLLLVPVATSRDENLRRFAVEVTRPRSVWGAHIEQLKRHPGLGRELLDAVRADPARYVQLATGNWLNDASKSRPDWVLALAAEWRKSGDANTDKIVRRALRTISKHQGQAAHGDDLFPVSPLGVS
jgi:3-methyladenine DNA glycosylase AlkC